MKKNVSRQIKKETEDFIESKENEYRAYPNLWNTMRAVLIGKFIALCVYIKKNPELSHTNNLAAYIAV